MLDHEDSEETKDYDEIVSKIISENEKNQKFDEKYIELKTFIVNNHKKKCSIIREELYTRLTDLRSISEHRLTNLLLDKSLFPFIYEQKPTRSGLNFANYFVTAICKTNGTKKVSRKESLMISRLIESGKYQNRLIRKLERYIDLKITDESKHDKYMKVIKAFEKHLLELPAINALIDKTLTEEDHQHTNRMMKLEEENEKNIVQLFTQKEYDRTIKLVAKNPDLFYLLFNFWGDIAEKNCLVYKSGRRQGKPNDSKIIIWILDLMGRKYVNYKNSEFKKIQKRWNSYKNKHN